MEARLFHTFGAPVENAQSPSVFFVMIEGATSTIHLKASIAIHHCNFHHFQFLIRNLA